VAKKMQILMSWLMAHLD